MIDELRKLREITDTLTGNGYLRDQAEEWEYALDAIPDCVYIINNRFEIKFVNKALANRIGISKTNLYGKICYDVIIGAIKQEFPDDWKDPKFIISNPLLKEVYLENLSGWFDATRSPIYTKMNKLIGFICILQDVTAKKVAFDNLLYREATLDAVFNAVPLGMGLMDFKTRSVLSINKYMTDLTGYSEEELLYASDRLLYESYDEFYRVGKLSRENMEEGITSTIETTFLTKSGKLIDVSLKTSKIKGKNSSSVVFTVTVVADKKVKENNKLLHK